MEETYDEFSEFVAQAAEQDTTAASLFPASASHTVAAAMEAGDDDENLENRSTSRNSDDVDEVVTALELNDTEMVHVDDEEEIADLLDADADQTNDEGDEGADIIHDVDEDQPDDEAHQSDNEEPARGEPSPDDEEGGAEQAAPSLAAASSGQRIPFAISRIKALFNHANQHSRREMGTPTECILSADAATLMAEAVGLFLRDFVMAGLSETQRRDKKTVTYDDLSFAALHLDRFAFLSDVLPSAAAVRSRPMDVQRAQQARARAKTTPSVPAKKSAPAPPASSGGQRQTTLNFGSRAH